MARADRMRRVPAGKEGAAAPSASRPRPSPPRSAPRARRKYGETTCAWPSHRARTSLDRPATYIARPRPGPGSTSPTACSPGRRPADAHPHLHSRSAARHVHRIADRHQQALDARSTTETTETAETTETWRGRSAGPLLHGRGNPGQLPPPRWRAARLSSSPGWKPASRFGSGPAVSILTTGKARLTLSSQRTALSTTGLAVSLTSPWKHLRKVAPGTLARPRARHRRPGLNRPHRNGRTRPHANRAQMIR
jgi:hypothetical protein